MLPQPALPPPARTCTAAGFAAACSCRAAPCPPRRRCAAWPRGSWCGTRPSGLRSAATPPQSACGASPPTAGPSRPACARASPPCLPGRASDRVGGCVRGTGGAHGARARQGALPQARRRACSSPASRVRRRRLLTALRLCVVRKNIVLERWRVAQQVVHHGLVRPLVDDGRHWVKPSVCEDELARLALGHRPRALQRRQSLVQLHRDALRHQQPRLEAGRELLPWRRGGAEADGWHLSQRGKDGGQARGHAFNLRAVRGGRVHRRAKKGAQRALLVRGKGAAVHHEVLDVHLAGGGGRGGWSGAA